MYTLFKNPVITPQKAHCVPIRIINWVMLFRKKQSLFILRNLNLISKFMGRMQGFVMLKQAVHIVAIML
jgi:hypothetical protein